MSATVTVGTILTIRTHDGKTFTGGVKALEKGNTIIMQLYQPGPPALKSIQRQEIANSAIVEPGKIHFNLLKDQVLECYKKIVQCNYNIDISRPHLQMASSDMRKEIETKILLNQNEIKTQKKMHKGLEPHVAALSEKERQVMNMLVHQQNTAHAKKVSELKRLQHQQLADQQKAALQKKGVVARTPSQSKTMTKSTAQIRQKSGDTYSPGVQSQSAAAVAAKQKKMPMTKAGKIGQLIKAIPADKQSATKVMTKRKLQQLVAQVAPHEKLDEDVEDLLLDIADDFIESVTDFGCLLARHRNSKVLEVKDIQLHLERNWNMRIPGFGSDQVHAPRRTISDIHKQRMSQVKKAQGLGEKK